MLKRWWPLGPLCLLLAGCTSTRITNMTPLSAPRSPDGLYTIEARWDSNQRSIRNETFKPYVLVGTDFYPMERVQLTTNRWEAVVPAGTNQTFLLYRFKFDYEYNGIPSRKKDSRLSPNHQLQIVD